MRYCVLPFYIDIKVSNRDPPTMKMTIKYASFAALTLTGTSLLAGCAGFGGASFPATSGATAQTALGNIQGSDYGGHAPLTGAHIYVLQTATTGYGAQATSLITGSASTCNGAVNQICANTADAGVPTSWYYMQADSNGAFNITGDYTCTAGVPVYLYGYSGSPTYPSGSNVFQINQVATSNLAGSGSNATATYTLTTTTTENFYIGETVMGSGFTGYYTVLNATLTVTSTNLTTTTFAVSSGQVSGIAAGTVATTGTITAQPGNNVAAVNLAMLGNCPSSGNFSTGGTLYDGATFTPLQYVYMNEVSTAAMAFALEGFATTSNNNATYIGTSSTNLTGIRNAARTARQLYDIQGGELSTSYAGEGHIARVNTSNGNGIVPQATLDTLGNILAACVDSNYTTASPSPQCTTLFQNATSNGIPYGTAGAGTLPIDTAQSAINIAHNPAGAAANSSTVMSNLYTLPTGNVPFTPHLTTQPNDFTIAIQYPKSLNPQANGPESVGIDRNGNIWGNSISNKYLYEFSPVGVSLYTSPAASYSYGYVRTDANNNIWAGAANSVGPETEVVTTGATPVLNTFPIAATAPFDSYATIVHTNGNIYIAAQASQSNQTFLLYGLTGAGAQLSSPYPVSLGLAQNYVALHGIEENVSVNGTGDIWYTTDTNAGVLRFNVSTNLPETGFPVTGLAGAPEQCSMDRSGNLWTGTYTGNTLIKVSPTGTVTSYTPGALNQPFGLAIDGDNNIYSGQRGGASVVKLTSAGVAISPAANYTLAGQLSQPLNMQADAAGTVWMTSYEGNMIVEWVGAGAPTISPLGYAASLNALATRP
jgi:streptogramin lyase